MGYVLGIDLGTTFSAAAIHRDDQAEIVTIGSRAAAVPSVVFLREDGSVLTGEAADRRALTEPGRVAREFKRRLGDPVPIMVGGSPYSAERLSAEVLKALVGDVVAQQGGAPDHIAICHPANWGPFKMDLLRQAVDLADFAGPGGVSYLTEPEAAAIHYTTAETIRPGEIVAVYDLGGGTFDAAVLRKTSTGFETLGEPQGIDRLGGIDFDAYVFDHVAASLGGALAALSANDPGAVAAVARLREECTAAKEALSSDTETSIPVLLPDVMDHVRLTRVEFEDMVRPAIAQSIETLQRAVESAGVGAGEVSRVLLVGGSSRIPLVGQMVSSALGRPVSADAHPKYAIALGAAIAARATAGGIDTAEAAAKTTAVIPVLDVSTFTQPVEAPEDVAGAISDRAVAAAAASAAEQTPSAMPWAAGAASASPGWYPDPTSRHQYRYHDGTDWTANVHDQGTSGLDPLSGPPPPSGPTSGPGPVVVPVPSTSPAAWPGAAGPDVTVAAPALAGPPARSGPPATPPPSTPGGATGGGRGRQRLLIVAIPLLVLLLGAGAYAVAGGGGGGPEAKVTTTTTTVKKPQPARSADTDATDSSDSSDRSDASESSDTSDFSDDSDDSSDLDPQGAVSLGEIDADAGISAPNLSDVMTSFDTYVSGINSGDTATAFAILSSNAQSRTSSEEFAAGNASSFITGFTIHTMGQTGGTATVNATFESTQVPDETNSFQACTDWDIAYSMVEDAGGAWLIDRAQVNSSLGC